MKYSFVLLIIINICSCEKENADLVAPKVDSINSYYFIKSRLNYGTGANLMATSKFYYNGDKIIKRSGSYEPIAGGYSYTYTDKVFDTVIYVNNSKILLESKSPYIKYPTKWELEITNGLLSKRVTNYYTSGDYKFVDTTLYYYDSNNRIEKTENYFYEKGTFSDGTSHVLTNEFLFDSKNNLQKTKGTHIEKPIDKPKTIRYTTEEEFSLYDNTPNPLKSLWMWDDLYYRSLSSNNFSKYTYKRWDGRNILQDSSVRIWKLQYDDKGKIIYR